MKGMIGLLAVIAVLVVSTGTAEAHHGQRFRGTPFRPGVGVIPTRNQGFHHNANFRFHNGANFGFHHNNLGFGFVPTRSHFSGFVYAPPVALAAPQGYSVPLPVIGSGYVAPTGVQAYGYQVQGVGFANPGCGRLLLGY